ncbi:hypothetical protein [Lentibacillus juripiscarius]|uniref:Transposase n=1 Tax=Lentibacillus juripiscarius TaxID=257446 RepID=A0ABW5VAE8_9BACI
MAIILPESEPKNEANSYISRFFKENKLGSLLNQANIRKADGFSPVFLLQFFFSLVLHGKNLYRILDSDRLSDAPRKDTVHRFLNFSGGLFLRNSTTRNRNEISKYLLVLKNVPADPSPCFNPSNTGDDRSNSMPFHEATISSFFILVP